MLRYLLVISVVVLNLGIVSQNVVCMQLAGFAGELGWNGRSGPATVIPETLHAAVSF